MSTRAVLVEEIYTEADERFKEKLGKANTAEARKKLRQAEAEDKIAGVSS